MAAPCSHCDVYWRPDITETVLAKIMATAPDPHEERAARWLQARGWQLVARNARYRGGELDIVARDGEQLVFVEVRRRSNPRFAGAAASVDRRKQRRLLHAAALFLQQHPQWSSYPCRFDVIAFEPRQSGANPEPRWIRAAFSV